ncbi:hypothetical protein KFE25_006389 [Diacronema lutheri]|uniref:Uncharacterized protein n=1 Tax=Diacronema lutheri TaxID=2081491 RepID=A0A8J5XSY2_DIALT|nr:hypothetical protein KFE25_006389 [Diacronema lutheri]
MGVATGGARAELARLRECARLAAAQLDAPLLLTAGNNTAVRLDAGAARARAVGCEGAGARWLPPGRAPLAGTHAHAAVLSRGAAGAGMPRAAHSAGMFGWRRAQPFSPGRTRPQSAHAHPRLLAHGGAQPLGGSDARPSGHHSARMLEAWVAARLASGGTEWEMAVAREHRSRQRPPVAMGHRAQLQPRPTSAGARLRVSKPHGAGSTPASHLGVRACAREHPPSHPVVAAGIGPAAMRTGTAPLPTGALSVSVARRPVSAV